ncbi:MAG: DUF1501 domain-containing protein [Pirellulales bacterium]
MANLERLAAINGQGFSIWLAGAGVRGGMTFGATDEFGHKAVENVVTPNDFLKPRSCTCLDFDWQQVIYPSQQS